VAISAYSQATAGRGMANGLPRFGTVEAIHHGVRSGRTGRDRCYFSLTILHAFYGLICTSGRSRPIAAFRRLVVCGWSWNVFISPNLRIDIISCLQMVTVRGKHEIVSIMVTPDNSDVIVGANPVPRQRALDQRAVVIKRDVSGDESRP
jgi:hypothetical protein